MGIAEKLAEYRELMAIKRGHYGIVHKVEHISTKKIYARKTVKYGKLDQRGVELIMREANLLSRMKHINVLGYHDVVIDEVEKVIYIFTEFCNKGDLFQLIDKHRYPRTNIPEERIWKLFGQLLLALEYCHCPTKENFELGEIVIHRDIKPANILITNDDVVKLADFGFSRSFNSSDMLKTQLGTPSYTAPEVLNKTPYNEKADIWSLGCVIFHLCSLEFPFQAMTHADLARNVRDGKRRPFPQGIYSKELEELVDSMMIVDYTQRPSAAQLIRHRKFIEHGVITADYLNTNPTEEIDDKAKMIAELKMCLKMKQQEVDNLEDDLSNNKEIMEAMTITKTASAPSGTATSSAESNNDAVEKLRAELSLQSMRVKQLEAENSELRSQNTILTNKILKLEEAARRVAQAQSAIASDGMTALMRAVQMNDIAGIKAHIATDAGKKNRKGKTALMMCSDTGKTEAAALLIPYEAGTKMSDGTTALILAAIAGHVDIVNILKKKEGKMQARQGDTALINAAVTGHAEVVRALVEIEAGLRMDDGRAAIHNAAYKGHLECVKILLPYEYHMRDKSGLSPLKYASKGKQEAVVDYIRTWLQTNNK
ncbi:Kinase, NEK [Giardia duodenalis]|uniref:non-specific serine/threonine protein kinase n=2 Tax=Giardia intestinalis TaxID=5741 RepID=A8BXP9_GIAIC|nr:Kinase, NEK [Giardia intestinalis]ESU35200.1 Serine/threonine protein kinase [Giardia intestinalis]KAE8304625.1 Kinase, NEK [Giardia intestinalis]|eukprot:XP_001704268.1 Kinase, NEK [Giardia lamblia ATCC 50803]